METLYLVIIINIGAHILQFGEIITLTLEVDHKFKEAIIDSLETDINGQVITFICLGHQQEVNLLILEDQVMVVKDGEDGEESGEI